MRICENIIGLDGQEVILEKGTYCQIMNWTRHRNSKLWGKDVDIFNPNREFKDSEIWHHEGGFLSRKSHVTGELIDRIHSIYRLDLSVY